MPRIIEERWLGVGFDVVTEQVQETDERGNGIFDGNGLPKMVDWTTLVVIVPMPDGQRIVRIPFVAEARQELVRKLVGGIVIANGETPLPKPGQ